MKYLALILVFVGGLSINEASAQDYLFRVLANKGTNEIKKNGSSASAQLKTGAKLYSGDQIIAEEGAYIGLVYKTGKTVEVRNSGVYNVEDLAAKVSKGSASMTSRYMSFLTKKMNEDDENVNKNYRRNLNATGAVSRAPGYDLSILMMDSGTPNKVIGDEVLVRWEGGEENDSYIVTVKDIFSDVIYETNSSDSKIALDFNSEELKSYNYLLVSVKSATSEKKSEEYGIQKLNISETSLQSSIEELEAQLTEGSSLNDLVYASFYEDQSLYLDALTKYDAVVSDNPDVEDFKIIYNQFVGSEELGGE